MKTAQERFEAACSITGLSLTLASIRKLKTVGQGQFTNRKDAGPDAVGILTINVYRAADERDRDCNPVIIERWCEPEKRMLPYVELDWDGEPVLPEIDEWEDYNI